MFGQLIEYWYLTGDDQYNDIVTQGLLHQVGEHNDYMPENQTKTEVRRSSQRLIEVCLTRRRETTIKLSGLSRFCPP